MARLSDSALGRRSYVRQEFVNGFAPLIGQYGKFGCPGSTSADALPASAGPGHFDDGDSGAPGRTIYAHA